jgi:hypothetical protein
MELECFGLVGQCVSADFLGIMGLGRPQCEYYLAVSFNVGATRVGERGGESCMGGAETEKGE